MIKRCILYSLSLILFAGCKKDKLEDEKEIFIGKWKWIYSTAIIDICDPPTYADTLTPVETFTQYSLELKKKGKIRLYKNNELVNEYRIVFQAFGDPYSCASVGYTYFGIALDNDSNNDMDGCVSNDTLIIERGFPFDDSDCNYYTNYFIRE